MKGCALSSGNIVDQSLDLTNLTDCIFLRGAVIREYTKYNNLWRSVVAPLDTLEGIIWWLVTSNEYEDQQEEHESIEVFRSREAYLEENGIIAEIHV